MSARYIGIRVVSADDGTTVDILPYSRPRGANESELVLRGTMRNADRERFLFEEIQAERGRNPELEIEALEAERARLGQERAE